MKQTGKVVTSSYTCAIFIGLSGFVTLICGAVMIGVGDQSDDVDQEGKDFFLIGGSLFFLLGLTLVVGTIIYAVVHYFRQQAKKDPLGIRKTEIERRKREASAEAASNGSVFNQPEVRKNSSQSERRT